MDFEIKPYIVYIRADDQNRISAVNSSVFLKSTDSWIAIDEGFGDRYGHAQGNYFPKPSCDERGIHRYMAAPIADYPDREAYHVYEYEGENWGIYERTQAEMDADYIPPAPAPNNDQRIADLEAAMAAIEEGIASV